MTVARSNLWRSVDQPDAHARDHRAGSPPRTQLRQDHSQARRREGGPRRGVRYVMETAIADSQLSNPGQADDAAAVASRIQAISFESDATHPSKVTMTCDIGPLQAVLTLDAVTLFPSLKSFLARRPQQHGDN